MRMCLLLLSAAFLTACVTQQQIPPEQKVAITTRQYADAKPAQALESAQRIFELADDANEREIVQSSPTALTVDRYAGGPVGMSYRWNITALPVDQGTRVTVEVEYGYTGMYHIGGIHYIEAPMSPDLYELFYSRLDYLLGKAKSWPSCSEYGFSHPHASSLEPLCYKAEDRTPS